MKRSAPRLTRNNCLHFLMVCNLHGHMHSLHWLLIVIGLRKGLRHTIDLGSKQHFEPPRASSVQKHHLQRTHHTEKKIRVEGFEVCKKMTTEHIEPQI